MCIVVLHAARFGLNTAHSSLFAFGSTVGNLALRGLKLNQKENEMTEDEFHIQMASARDKAEPAPVAAPVGFRYKNKDEQEDDWSWLPIRFLERNKSEGRVFELLYTHPQPNEELLQYKTALEMLGIENDKLKTKIDAKDKTIDELALQKGILKAEIGRLKDENYAKPVSVVKWWNLIHEDNEYDTFACKSCGNQVKVHIHGTPLPEECPKCGKQPKTQADKIRQAADEYEQAVSLAEKQFRQKLDAALADK
jgi:predicted RNA-binding Zn-ribbon protein involved in translation (DUF1610 family)